jgi:hypothetical protein
MSSDTTLEEISFHDLPHYLVEELLKYGVVMIGIDRQAQKLAHQGSGTFVQYKGRHYILTAAHCAKPLQNYKEMGLVIRPDADSKTHPIPEPIYVGDYREYGPDLAFLPLTQETIDYVLSNSNKVFYDLERHRDEMLREEPRLRYGLWGLIGSPGKLCDLTDPGRLIFEVRAFSVGLEPRSVDDDFDYIHVRVALDKPGVLDYYGGISGGGLWQFEVGRNIPDGRYLILGEPKLEGTVFLQLNFQGSDVMYFRCHSRNSIYDKALAVLDALPAQE